MRVDTTPRSSAPTADGGRRPYDSRLRRARAAETRTRIVTAGAALFREATSWDWASLTFRAVAERAGVSERTVYRYFPTDVALREAIGQEVEEQAGVAYDDPDLDGFATTAARVLELLPAYTARWPVHDHDVRRTTALRTALRAETDAASDAATDVWSERERTAAAAALDVVWSVPVYERMLRVWELDHDDAIEVMRWMHRLVADAIREGDRP